MDIAGTGKLASQTLIQSISKNIDNCFECKTSEQQF